MTTPNHSMIAGMAAVAVSHASSNAQITAGFALFVGHFVLDIVPHKHWWGNLHDHNPLAKSNRLLVALEVLVGMVVVPALIVVLFEVDPVLVSGFALAANLPDFIAPFLSLVHRLNTLVHWWEYTLPPAMMKWSEAVQTSLLLALTLLLWAS